MESVKTHVWEDMHVLVIHYVLCTKVGVWWRDADSHQQIGPLSSIPVGLPVAEICLVPPVTGWSLREETPPHTHKHHAACKRPLI